MKKSMKSQSAYWVSKLETESFSLAVHGDVKLQK